MATNATTPVATSHGWIGTETIKTRWATSSSGTAIPRGRGRALREALVFNRAVEAYLAQMHGVSWYRVWKGVAEAGSGAPNQLVIWET